MPLQEECLRGSSKSCLTVGIGKHLLPFPVDSKVLIAITSEHVEIDTRDIAFVLIGRLEDSGTIGTVTGLRTRCVRPGRCTAHFSVRVIRALRIRGRVGRNHMVQIGTHALGIHIAPPTLRQHMLAVIALTLFGIFNNARTVTTAAERTICVHVPNGVVSAVVHTRLVRAEEIILQRIRVFDLLMKRSQDLCARHAFELRITGLFTGVLVRGFQYTEGTIHYFSTAIVLQLPGELHVFAHLKGTFVILIGSCQTPAFQERSGTIRIVIHIEIAILITRIAINPLRYVSTAGIGIRRSGSISQTKTVIDVYDICHGVELTRELRAQ